MPPSLCFLKFLCYVLEQFAYRQVLRAYLFALAAFDTVGSLASRSGVYDIVVIVGVPVVIKLLRVHDGEQVRYRNMLGTSVGAVAAGGTRDEVLAVEYLLHLLDGGKLLFVQRLEILHDGNVVLHLFHVAHAGENHHTGESCGKTKSVACGTSSVKLVKYSLCVFGKIYKVAAFHGFHDDDGLVVLYANLIAGAALYGGIIVVGVVELYL